MTTKELQEQLEVAKKVASTLRFEAERIMFEAVKLELLIERMEEKLPPF